MSCILCLASLGAIPVLRAKEFDYFSSAEPFYAIPVSTSSLIVPLRNDAYGKGAYGVSRNGGRKHKGLDFLSEIGKPVTASKSGRVHFAGYAKGYGYHVIIFHPDGLSTRYAHLEELPTRTGVWVRLGQRIGTIGKSGNADHSQILPHLHFEIRQGRSDLDPTQGHLDPRYLIH